MTTVGCGSNRCDVLRDTYTHTVQVRDIKVELAGLGERIEEMRGVCRQLQSQLKNFPDCSETNFEAEADALMDTWLDVSVPVLLSSHCFHSSPSSDILVESGQP